MNCRTTTPTATTGILVSLGEPWSARDLGSGVLLGTRLKEKI